MINLNRLYKDGFDSIILDQVCLSDLTRLVAEEQWCDTEEPIEGEQIQRIPLWQYSMQQSFKSNNSNESACVRESREAEELRRCTPHKYSAFFSSLLKMPRYNGFLDSFYDIEIDAIRLWDGVGAPYWHWDGPGNSDMFMLVYLSDMKSWDKSRGGGISVGERDLQDHSREWPSICGEVSNIQTLYPDNGRMIIATNQNPRLVHRPIQLTEEGLKAKRITFLVTLKLNTPGAN